MRSRLRSNVKKQSIHIIVFIIAIVIILIASGTHLLVGFSVVLEKIKGAEKEEIHQQGINYIAPPVVNPIPTATKEDNIDISGTTTSNNVFVALFVNGRYVEKTKTDTSGSFSFENVRLVTGDNEIKAKSISTDRKESDYSEKLKIKYLNKNPNLELNNLTDGQTFKKDQNPIRISGKTDPGVKVTVNDFWTIINDNGDFYYMYNLRDGVNNLKIVASDEAGNSTSKEINIRAE